MSHHHIGRAGRFQLSGPGPGPVNSSPIPTVWFHCSRDPPNHRGSARFSCPRPPLRRQRPPAGPGRHNGAPDRPHGAAGPSPRPRPSLTPYDSNHFVGRHRRGIGMSRPACPVPGEEPCVSDFLLRRVVGLLAPAWPCSARHRLPWPRASPDPLAGNEKSSSAGSTSRAFSDELSTASTSHQRSHPGHPGHRRRAATGAPVEGL